MRTRANPLTHRSGYTAGEPGGDTAKTERTDDMELTTKDLIAAQQGRHVLLRAEGRTYYLLSQEAYDRLDAVEGEVMTKNEMDLLADEASEIIAQGETDEFRTR